MNEILVRSQPKIAHVSPLATNPVLLSMIPMLVITKSPEAFDVFIQYQLSCNDLIM